MKATQYEYKGRDRARAFEGTRNHEFIPMLVVSIKSGNVLWDNMPESLGYTFNGEEDEEEAI